METTEQHLFAENEYHLVQASGGKRFANYIVDLFVFYILLFLVGMLLGMMDARFIDSINVEEPGLTLFDLIFVLSYIVYMFLIELIFKGKSPGKLITGTRAVKEDGSYVTVRDTLLRALCRLVPLEPFSALGSPCYPWHDRWTKTYVIDERQSNFPGA